MVEVKKIIELESRLKTLRYDEWINNVLFSFNWWLLLFLTIIPWILWLKYVQRDRLISILLYGALITIYSILLDDIGAYLQLWVYQFQLVPITPRLNPIVLAVMPVTYMFIYQIFRKWKTFIIAQTILAFGAAFITEPFFEKLGIYKLLNWNYLISFFIYILLGTFNKIIVDKIEKYKFTT